MAASRPPDPSARIAELEKELRELKARVIALERLMGTGEEHPSDQTTVRRKVAYDWQA
jgi:ribosomal protein L29